MALAPDVPYDIGDFAFGGYVAGIIDTTRGNIIAADASQTGQRYVLIVSPKSLETTRAWKTSQSAGPAATRTRWDGLAATLAMNTSEYPAARYCAGLSHPADDASGWYLPAMDELELIYRNLKSTTESNSTGNRTGGDFPGGTINHGENPSSDPNGAAYTSTNPAQTTVAAFRDDGGQDLGDSGTSVYFWASTEYNSPFAWVQKASGSSPGYQGNIYKTDSYSVRPVRRILVSDLNTAPDAPTLVTPVGATIDRNSTNRFDWDFSDPDPGDSQSKYDLRYRITGTSTWTTVSNSVPNTYHDFAAGTFALGDYEWQARTYDAQGAVGPWSSSAFFTAGDAPASPTITTPVNGGTFLQTQPVEWSTPVQDAYQIQVRDTGDVVVYDSGEVATTTVRSATVPFPDNGTTRKLRLRVKDGGLWSPWYEITGTVSWLAPPVPSFTLIEDTANGSLSVSISNPAPVGAEPAAVYNDVTVDDGDGFDYKYGSRQIAPNGTWVYYLPIGGRDYSGSIKVTAVADNGVTSST